MDARPPPLETAPAGRLGGAVLVWPTPGAGAELELWGVPVWLRLVRQLTAMAVAPIWLSGDVPRPVRDTAVRSGVGADLFSVPPTDRDDERYLLVQASWVFDAFILHELAVRPAPTVVVQASTRGVRSVGAAVVTGADLRAAGAERVERPGLHAWLVDDGGARRLDVSELPTYRLQMRRHLTPFAIEIDGAETLRAAEARTLDAAQKGTNDLPAQYLHPPLENALVRALVPLGVTPNVATVVTIVVGLGVAALFQAGHFVLGMLGAVAVGVLDGVDGKIARVTVNATRSGDVFEHVADNVYEILWYLGFGAGLAAMTGNATYRFVAWAVVIVYLLDRAALGVWKLFRDGDFHESSPWDQKFRRICGRRNNIVFLMLPFVVLGRPEAGFAAALGWWSLTFVIHAVRVGRALWLGRDRSTHSSPNPL